MTEPCVTFSMYSKRPGAIFVDGGATLTAE